MTASQHVPAMVGLDHQCIEVPVTVQHPVAIGAQVGQQAETPLAVTEDILRRLLCIVGHGNDTDAPGRRSAVARRRPASLRVQSVCASAQGAAAEVDRQIAAPRQQTHAMRGRLVRGSPVSRLAALRFIRSRSRRFSVSTQGRNHNPPAHTYRRWLSAYPFPYATAAENGKTYGSARVVLNLAQHLALATSCRRTVTDVFLDGDLDVLAIPCSGEPDNARHGTSSFFLARRTAEAGC